MIRVNDTCSQRFQQVCLAKLLFKTSGRQLKWAVNYIGRLEHRHLILLNEMKLLCGTLDLSDSNPHRLLGGGQVNLPGCNPRVEFPRKRTVVPANSTQRRAPEGLENVVPAIGMKVFTTISNDCTFASTTR